MEALPQVHWRRSARVQAQRCAVTLAVLTALITLRVLAQVIQAMQPTTLLPPFTAFEGSLLPYAVLLPLQVLVVIVLSQVTLAVASGAVPPQPTRGVQLLAGGGLYAAVCISRIVVGLAWPEAPAWFRAWIPAATHLLLASYVLTLATYHLRRP